MSRCPRCHQRFRLFGDRKYGGTLYQDDALSHGKLTCHRCPGSYLPSGDPVPSGYFDDFVMDTSQGFNMMRRKTEDERNGIWKLPPDPPTVVPPDDVWVTTTSARPDSYKWMDMWNTDKEASVAKYRKKPVVVEARQAKSYLDFPELAGWVNNNGGAASFAQNPSGPAFMTVHTKEGPMRADVFDWIIKEPFPTDDRSFYPCKPGIFEASYEPVDEPEPLPADYSETAE